MTPFRLIELARRACSAEELIALAKEEKVKLSHDDARIYFERWHDAEELGDDDLEEVGGGVDRTAGKTVCELCGSEELLFDVSGGYFCPSCKRHCWGKQL